MNMRASTYKILPGFLLAAVTTAALSAELPVLSLGAEQARASGIVTQPVPAAARGEQAGAGLRLPGMAVFPTKAVQVVSAPAAGMVEAILADPMDTVGAGAPLIRLRSPQVLEWQRSYVQAGVQARLAADKFRRDESLYKEGIIAESRVQESRGAMIQSEAALREQRQMLKLAGFSDKALAALSGPQGMSPVVTISSPQRGIVLEQLASIGQRVEAGAPLIKVAQQDRLWVELQATRQQGAGVRIGDSVRIEGCQQAGKVTGTGMQMNQANQTITIRAEFPSIASCLRPNQHVEATVGVRSQQEDAVQVKAGSLVTQAGKTYVFVHEQNGFRPVEVDVLSRDSDTATVRGPIRAGQELAVQGVSSLKGMWLGLGAGAGEAK